MTTEKSGDPVFANVDDALAERIISRSNENSRTPYAARDGAADPKISGFGLGIRPSESFPLLKIAAVIIGAAVLMMLLFGRGGKKQ